MTTLILALVLGAAFGFALNRVGATNPQNIINMLRLTDLHLARVIMFAVGLASLLLFAGLAAGLIDAGNLSVKATYSGVILGGLLLGVGFAIAGYCPGTGLAAAATGRFDGWVFVLGGLAGALAYAIVYEGVAGTGLLDALFGGKVTVAGTGTGKFPALLGDWPGLVVAGVLGAGMMVIAALLPRAFRKDDLQ